MKYVLGASRFRKHMKRTSIAILALVSLALAGVAQGVTQVTATFTTPVHVNTAATTSGCNNAPGPTVTLQGELAIGGLGVQLVFKNNMKGTHTHTEQSTATAVVIPAGESIQIPKQPVLGGTGGNPFIWLQFLDNQNNALTGEIFLGRCVQGLFETVTDFFLPSTAIAKVSSDSCDNTGSTITLNGELRLTGINARLIFRNNDNPVGGPHENDQKTTVDIVIIPAGQSIQFAKQPPLGGVGGNPLVYLAFLNGQGQSVSSEFLLGRCNKL